MFQVDLKVLLGLILLNQYCHVVVRKYQVRFLGDILLRAMLLPSLSLLILHNLQIQGGSTKNY